MSNQNTAQRPVDRLTVVVGGNSKELFMSFGLLNELCRLYGDVHAATQVTLNPDLRDVTMISLFSERDENGLIPEGKEVRLAKLEISLDDAERVLNWAADHAIYFFLTALKRAVEAQKQNAALKDLLQVAGVKVESSTTSSSGTKA